MILKNSLKSIQSKLQAFLGSIDNKRSQALIQFIKFGLVGVTNTLISYGVEMLCYYVVFKSYSFNNITSFFHQYKFYVTSEEIKVMTVTALAFIISVTNSYFLNSRFVFKAGSNNSSSKGIVYMKTVFCYALTGLIIAPLIKMQLVTAHIPYWFASLCALIVTIPLNFLMNKFWAYSKNQSRKER